MKSLASASFMCLILISMNSLSQASELELTPELRNQLTAPTAAPYVIATCTDNDCSNCAVNLTVDSIENLLETGLCSVDQINRFAEVVRNTPAISGLQSPSTTSSGLADTSPRNAENESVIATSGVQGNDELYDALMEIVSPRSASSAATCSAIEGAIGNPMSYKIPFGDGEAYIVKDGELQIDKIPDECSEM